jgi:hypothetical protein
MWQAVWLFLFYLVFDFLFGLYMLAYNKGKKWTASTLSTIITVAGILGTVEVFKYGLELLIPIGLGVFWGTFLSLVAKEIYQKDENRQ